MAYEGFAYWYDELNVEADYDSLADALLGRLKAHGIPDGIVADLGCGTGEVALRLQAKGYDVIAVDASADMLSVLRDKMAERGVTGILTLQQSLAGLDLYGTIRAAVCTFDTLNHLDGEDVRKALGRASLFMEPCGLLLFDVNTPYKHEQILGNNTFTLEMDEETVCTWSNRYDAAQGCTDISIEISQDSDTLVEEQFCEYSYRLEEWDEWLEAAGFTVLEHCDGESFGDITPTTQRYFITAKKK